MVAIYATMDASYQIMLHVAYLGNSNSYGVTHASCFCFWGPQMIFCRDCQQIVDALEHEFTEEEQADWDCDPSSLDAPDPNATSEMVCGDCGSNQIHDIN